jgi:hypothetical protein
LIAKDFVASEFLGQKLRLTIFELFLKPFGYHIVIKGGIPDVVRLARSEYLFWVILGLEVFMLGWWWIDARIRLVRGFKFFFFLRNGAWLFPHCGFGPLDVRFLKLNN